MKMTRVGLDAVLSKLSMIRNERVENERVIVWNLDSKVTGNLYNPRVKYHKKTKKYLVVTYDLKDRYKYSLDTCINRVKLGKYDAEAIGCKYEYYCTTTNPSICLEMLGICPEDWK